MDVMGSCFTVVFLLNMPKSSRQWVLAPLCSRVFSAVRQQLLFSARSVASASSTVSRFVFCGAGARELLLLTCEVNFRFFCSAHFLTSLLLRFSGSTQAVEISCSYRWTPLSRHRYPPLLLDIAELPVAIFPFF